MAIMFVVIMPRVPRPEYAALAGLLAALLGTGLTILVAHGHALFALPFLTALIFSSAAGAPRPSAVARTVVSASVIMVAVALLVGAHKIFGNPSILVFPLALLGSVALFGYAIGQSTMDHRAVAAVDPLTGTLTRTALLSRVSELSLGDTLIDRPVSVVIADLDYFKAINDEHGHVTGDQVLTEVAGRLRASVRVFDSVYRIGGEEFLMLLMDTDERTAVTAAERVRAAIRDQPVAGHDVTVSLGVATRAAGTQLDYDALFAEADAALLAAKASGRDRVLSGPPRPDHALAA